MVAGECIAELFGRDSEGALVGAMLLATLIHVQAGDPNA